MLNKQKIEKMNKQVFFVQNLGLPDVVVDELAEDDHPDHDSLHRGGQASLGRRTHEKRKAFGRRLSLKVKQIVYLHACPFVHLLICFICVSRMSD